MKPILFLSIVFLLPAAKAADLCKDMKPGVNHIAVMSGGQKQDLDLLLPTAFDAGKRVPLVIGLHPSGGSGSSFAEDTGLAAASSAKGFASVFPNGGVRFPREDGGKGHYWNIPGVPLVTGAAVPNGTRDDVRFIAEVIDHVVKNNCIDPRRIFVTGFSGGARMTSTVGCRLADRVAAIGPVAGLRAGRAAAPQFTEPDAADCRPARALSVLAVHGTDDSTNPFPGGQGVRWGYSVERAAERWAGLDRCSASPSIEKFSPLVTRVSFGACGTGSEVLLYRIDAPREQGGGHVWPGSRRDLSTRAPAPAANAPTGGVDLNATSLVLEFFSRH